jgi:hypothetical protein
MPNSMTEIKAFLSTPERPVVGKEMIDFWSSLSDEEKEDFRVAELKK